MPVYPIGFDAPCAPAHIGGILEYQLGLARYVHQQVHPGRDECIVEQLMNVRTHADACSIAIAYGIGDDIPEWFQRLAWTAAITMIMQDSGDPTAVVDRFAPDTIFGFGDEFELHG